MSIMKSVQEACQKLTGTYDETKVREHLTEEGLIGEGEDVELQPLNNVQNDDSVYRLEDLEEASLVSIGSDGRVEVAENKHQLEAANRLRAVSRTTQEVEVRPDGTVYFDDGLSLEYVDSDEIKKLPEGLVVDGYLNMTETDPSVMPSELTVNGTFRVPEAAETLPENGTYHGDVHLGQSNITDLSPLSTVEGDLVLTETDVQSIPDDIELEGGVYARGSALQSVPEALVEGDAIQGSFVGAQTDIEALPEGVRTVRGDLNLEKTPLSELPDNLLVEGDLNVADTDLQSLPDNLTVQGDLNVQNTGIEVDFDKRDNDDTPNVSGRIKADYEHVEGHQHVADQMVEEYSEIIEGITTKDTVVPFKKKVDEFYEKAQELARQTDEIAATDMLKDLAQKQLERYKQTSNEVKGNRALAVMTLALDRYAEETGDQKHGKKKLLEAHDAHPEHFEYFFGYYNLTDIAVNAALLNWLL